MTATATRAARILERVAPSAAVDAPAPVEWIASALGERLWSKQVEIAESVAANRYTAVQSAQGVGKSWLAARLVAWWCSAHPVDEVLAVTTAPSSDQVDGILWRELSRAHDAGQLAGTLTGQSGTRYWRMPDGRLLALGRKSADFADDERAAASFQGLHARRVLVVLDEAVGVQPWLWTAVAALVTNDDSRVLALGNPTDPSSKFAEACSPGTRWNTIRVSAFDTPAFTGERVSPELKAVLPGRQWLEECATEWGEGSPRYVARVLGEFPEQADDGLIARSWIRDAQERDLSGEAVGDAGALAFDVGRTGDETVGYELRGGVARMVHSARGQDLMRTTGAIVRLARGRSAQVVVDATGIGFGVVDRLREQGVAVRAFQGGERARRPERFVNRRAESFWALREAFREGRMDLDPDDDELARQLVQIRWREDSHGRVVIESKDDMRKRGIASPDRADALSMAVGAGSRVAVLDQGDVGGGSVAVVPDGHGGWRVVGGPVEQGPAWAGFEERAAAGNDW